MLNDSGRVRAIAWIGAACGAIALGACAEGDSREGERLVLSLTDELPFADVRFPVDRIDLGSPSARPHQVHGWSWDESYGGGDGTFTWSHGPTSRLRFREERSAPLRLGLACFPMDVPGRPEQTIEVIVNGTPVATVTPDPSGAEVPVDVPESSVRAGDNVLDLRYGYTVVPRNETPGSTDWRPLAVGWDGIRFESAGRRAPTPPSATNRGVLTLPPGTAVTFHADVPARARLSLGRVRGDGELVVRVTDVEERAREVVVLPGKNASVDLTADRPAILALTLEARGGEGAGTIVVDDPEIRAPEGASPSAAPPSHEEPEADETPRQRLNVVLYLVDTLREDALGCYGNPDAFTPHVDAFARAGVQFRTAAAHSPWTRPSTASILSGLQPQAHGVERSGDALPAEVATLAETLADAGYRCGAFVSNTLVGREFHFDQGFGRFVFHPYPDPGSTADDLGDEATAWLADVAGGPFFAWIHTMDPHTPYVPPPGFRERFRPDPSLPELDTVAKLTAYASAAAGRDPSEVARQLTRLYLGEVARTDRAFGRLRRELERRGAARSTIVVFVSDHGEEFHEHGGWAHSRTLYGEVGDVPLVIGAPLDVAPPGAIGGRAEQVDIVPTVLDLVGIPAADLSGVALLPPGRRDGDRPSLQSNRLEGCTGDAITWGEWKLIRLPEGGKSVRLFDLRRDPGERNDVSEERPVITGYLSRLLDRQAAALPPPPGREEATLDPEVLARLEALGYAGP